MTFQDPRDDPSPPFDGARPPLAEGPEEVADLIAAIKDGRLYQVERWIREGKPLQFTYPDRRRQWLSPLTAAIRAGQHDVTLLLLCNGYRPELELRHPLEEALKAGHIEIAHLLLDWGTNPTGACVTYALDSYDRGLLDRLWRLGYDLTAHHELAGSLSYSTSNKPLYGFIKRTAPRDPKLARELSIALCMAVRSGKEKAVAMCMWAGADPRAEVPYDVYHDEEGELGQTAMQAAVSGDHPRLLGALGLDPKRDDLDDLYRHADSGAAYDELRQVRPPGDPLALFNRALYRPDVAGPRSRPGTDRAAPGGGEPPGRGGPGGPALQARPAVPPRERGARPSIAPDAGSVFERGTGGPPGPDPLAEGPRAAQVSRDPEDGAAALPGSAGDLIGRPNNGPADPGHQGPPRYFLLMTWPQLAA